MKWFLWGIYVMITGRTRNTWLSDEQILPQSSALALVFVLVPKMSRVVSCFTMFVLTSKQTMKMWKWCEQDCVLNVILTMSLHDCSSANTSTSWQVTRDLLRSTMTIFLYDLKFSPKHWMNEGPHTLKLRTSQVVCTMRERTGWVIIVIVLVRIIER